MPAVPPGRRVRVRVPATSANLGPGFDSAGLALDLVDVLEVTTVPTGLEIDVRGHGAGAVPVDGSHLVVRAIHAAARRLDVEMPGLRLVCDNRIPHARGLGSSAAAIVSGLLAARELVDGGVDALPLSEVLALATAMEGHPDNVAAALLGGLTVAWTPAGDPDPDVAVLAGTRSVATGTVQVVWSAAAGVVRLVPAPEVVPVVLVPPRETSTRAARGALPALVPHADAAVAAGRAALLVAALTQVPGLLLPATHDLLHQPHRVPLMPETGALVAALRAEGLAAVVSGAGPTVLVLATDADQVAAALARCPDGWQARRSAVGTAAVAEVA